MTSRYVVISLQKRLFALIFAITFFLCIIFGRLFYVQVIDAENLTKKAYTEWFRDLPLSALRGNILDRNGVVLAYSTTTYDVWVRPASVTNKSLMQSTLSNILNISGDVLNEKISSKLSEVKIASNVSFETACVLAQNFQDGMYLTENSTREYPFDELLANLIGFTNSDGDGQTGLEYYFNQYLAGVDGKLVEQTDIKGRALADGISYYVSSIEGLSIRTTIDYRLQLKLEEVCEKALEQHSAKGVTAIVMNPQNSEVLAVCNKPSLNLNNISRDNVADLLASSKLLAVSDVYEPGSTFKILTGAIALELGLTSEGDGFYCPGYHIFNGVKVSCHKKTGHGAVSLAKGYSYSCNCVFMELATRIGLDKFYEFLDKMCFSSGYGTELKNEATAILMSKTLVQNFDLARMGFGQAVAVSPLILLNSVNCAINGGILYRPQFVSEIVSNDGESKYKNKTSKLATVFSQKTSNSLLKMLKDVVETGGGKNAKIEGLSIAGKTGTAQKYENGAIAQGKYVASFVGIYPAENPKYTILFIVDEPQGAYYGSVVSAPHASEVIAYIAETLEGELEAEKNYLNRRANASIVMPNVVGKSLTEAQSELAGLSFQVLTQGEGDYVIAQLQMEGTLMLERDVVLLTLGETSDVC